jgi:hypothetical protein
LAPIQARRIAGIYQPSLEQDILQSLPRDRL